MLNIKVRKVGHNELYRGKVMYLVRLRRPRASGPACAARGAPRARARGGSGGGVVHHRRARFDHRLLPTPRSSTTVAGPI